MEQQYTIWTILGYRMMYPVYGTILILSGLLIANNYRYRIAKKALLQKFSDNSLIGDLADYQLNEDSGKYDNISSNFNEIAGYRYFDLLTINWEDNSCVFLTEKLKGFFEKNKMLKKKLFENLKINSEIAVINSSSGKILGHHINNNLYILLMISKVSFPGINKR